MPKESDFSLVESPDLKPKEGELLVRTHFASVDPYMRGRISGVRSYVAPVEIGDVVPGGSAGEVVESLHPKYQKGDLVTGMWGWQEQALQDGKELRKLDPSLAPISTSLGVLGMPGLTAYFGLLSICNPKPDETVLVSGAAGAVGSLVGQIAKIKGCRAVGIAGGADKIKWLTDELGFDAAFDYKADTNYAAKLKELCPKGIDCYFDNVGGPITDAVMLNLNTGARVSVCGQISQYNLQKPEMGPRWMPQLIVKQARVEGFLVFQFYKQFQEGLTEMAGWLREGKLKHREDIVDGIENTPRAFIGMLQGDNIGKRLVRYN